MILSLLSSPPSDNFDLSNWKLQLPVDSDGDFDGRAIEVHDLSGYENRNYFFTGPDGAMVFRAPVEGATTSGSNYARSELREMDGTDRAQWTLEQGGTLSATLEIDYVPTRLDGSPGKIAIGQVHGGDDQMVRLYWDQGNVYFANDIDISGSKDLKIELLDSYGNEPDISIDERFSYSINIENDTLSVRVYADGTTYKSVTNIHDDWNDNEFYFKAGAYLGVNETQASGFGQVSFFGLDFNHAGDESIPETPDSVETVETALPETTRTYTGTDDANQIYGRDSNDLIQAGAGDDRLYGKLGNDVLVGGAGQDAFVFHTAPDSDTNNDFIVDFDVAEDIIWLSDNRDRFSRLDEGQLAGENFVYGSQAIDANDYIVYDQGRGALYYDADGSGPDAAVQFATIENYAQLSASDFLII